MTTESIPLNGLECTVVRIDSCQAVTYMLLPMVPSAQLLNAWAGRYNTSIVALYNFDWDNDLSPWPATNVPSSEPPFKGLAPQFLDRLLNNIFPTVEAGLPVNRRTILGISMSGLFALWAQCAANCPFDDLISISGSFWFPGFIPWLNDHMPDTNWRARFLLGVKEGAPGNPPAFLQIQQQTRDIVHSLAASGVDATFQSVPGNHFSDPAPRITLAMDSLFTKE